MVYAPKIPLETPVRQRALVQGLLLMLTAMAVLAVLRFLPEFKPRGLVIALGLVLYAAGLAASILGFWRLSVGRNLRWDLWGLAALVLMIPGIFLIGFYVMMLIAAFNGPLFPGR